MTDNFYAPVPYGELVLTPPGSGQRRTPGFSFVREK